MEIVYVKIKELIPAEYNPRQMTEKQAKDLMDSVKKFGLVDPVIVNSNPDRFNVVVGGHQRLKIALALGFEEVPVVYVNLDLKAEQELNLRLNRNLGEWNWDMLANFEESMLSEAGFDSMEIDKAKGNLKKENEDEIPAVEEPSSILPGDVFELGDHRLICGDATDFSSVQKLMGGGFCGYGFYRSALQRRLSGRNACGWYSKQTQENKKRQNVIGKLLPFSLRCLCKSHGCHTWGFLRLHEFVGIAQSLESVHRCRGSLADLHYLGQRPFYSFSLRLSASV